MIRSELIAKLAAENLGLTREDAEKVVRKMFDAISAHLAAGGRVELRGFGAFSVRKRDAHRGRNPRTGETVEVDATSVTYFRVGRELRRQLNAD